MLRIVLYNFAGKGKGDMIYSATITNNADTSETDANETTLVLTKGLVWLIEVEFPAGCCGLVHLQIFDGSYQLFPATIGENLRGNGVVLRYDDLYFKNTQPYSLKIKTWNDDENYQHTVQVRIGLASIDAFMARYLPSIAWDKFNNMLAKIVSDQEVIKSKAVEELQKDIPAIEENLENQET